MIRIMYFLYQSDELNNFHDKFIESSNYALADREN